MCVGTNGSLRKSQSFFPFRAGAIVSFPYTHGLTNFPSSQWRHVREGYRCEARGCSTAFLHRLSIGNQDGHSHFFQQQGSAQLRSFLRPLRSTNGIFSSAHSRLRWPRSPPPHSHLHLHFQSQRAHPLPPSSPSSPSIPTSSSSRAALAGWVCQ